MPPALPVLDEEVSMQSSPELPTYLDQAFQWWTVESGSSTTFSSSGNPRRKSGIPLNIFTKGKKSTFWKNVPGFIKMYLALPKMYQALSLY